MEIQSNSAPGDRFYLLKVLNVRDPW